MIIKIPQNNINEREYIVGVIFGEFLGLDSYELQIEDIKDYEIILNNSSKLIVKDSFFNQFKNNLEYLKEESIPKNVIFSKDDNLPILFGEDKITKEDNKIVWHNDIFASSFFMLSRWEEYVNKKRDNKDRFSAYDSVAYKFGFLNRPIVNEYVEKLFALLKEFDSSIKRKKREFNLILTHDVDVPLRYVSCFKFLKVLMADIVVRRNPILMIKRFFRDFPVFLKLKKDPFDTFDYIMDLSDKKGVKSYFFFMGRGTSKFDNQYKTSHPFVKALVTKIKNKKHHIGIHPTYNAYNNHKQFKQEKHEIENLINEPVRFGREHYLRFEVPTTWQIWEDN